MAASALYSCTKEPDPIVEEAAPALVSTSPENGATDIASASLDIVFTFDQNIKCSTSAATQIVVTPEVTVSKVNAYGAALTVSLSSLERGTKYTVSLPQGLVQGFKENQKGSAAISLSFSTKDKDPEPVHYTLDPTSSLSNASASTRAKKVYQFLLEQSGNKVLSGVQSSGTANNNDYLNQIYSRTGKHPAFAGYDFIFEQYSPTPASWSWKINYEDMSAPIEHWNAGGLVGYMWHWNVPASKEDWEKAKDFATNGYDFSGYNFYTEKTKFDIREILKEDTWQREYAIAEMDKVAGYLKILKDKDIPVIWRPFHEAAGNTYTQWQSGAWFWWGRYGAEPCKALWKMMYERFTNVHGLDNLIWVWTIDYVSGQEDAALEWYPGDDCVDIVGCDIYADDLKTKGEQYQFLVDVTKGKKLVTVSECGNVPDPEESLKAGHKWSWWMVWSDDYALNTETYWKKLMGYSTTITRENMPSLK